MWSIGQYVKYIGDPALVVTYSNVYGAPIPILFMGTSYIHVGDNTMGGLPVVRADDVFKISDNNNNRDEKYWELREEWERAHGPLFPRDQMGTRVSRCKLS
jgi:hypothetical protein